MGTGFPIIYLITLSVAYSKLTKNGITTWDKNGGFKISHLRIGALRTIIAVFLVVAFASDAWKGISKNNFLDVLSDLIGTILNLICILY